MKFMKLGTKPDTFYTDEAVRSVPSDVPTDLIVRISHTTYLLHKFPLLVKCGLVQLLCSDGGDNEAGEATPIALHDIPGGEEAFELCAKFCYGITINLSAHNFVAALSGAKFLRMNESVAKGNFISKLELFFHSCILEGWKDSILTLQAMWSHSGWSDDHRIVQPCMDSIIEKILIHPSQVSWSYTYTRPGYNKKKQKHAVPKDWWTEDVSDLDLELFRSIISTVKSTKKLPSALIGEALHVYSCKHMPSPLELQKHAQSSVNQSSELGMSKHRQVLEAIVSMIPAESRAVSGSFLLRLLEIAGHVRASSSTRAELVRRSGQQLDEVAASDLLISDIGMVEAVLESFLLQLCQSVPREETERVVASMAKVGRTFDSYLQIIAGDGALPVSKFIELAGSLPDMARTEHDGLYQAIDIFLREHPELSKAEKKRLCRMIECRKLSAEARLDAIGNDQLPLRTIVQLLFIDQETNGGVGAGAGAGANQEVSVAKVAAAQDEEKRSRNRAETRHHHREPALATRAERTRVVPSPSEPTRTIKHVQS
ncbi:BTB/POZ domain-containing protein At5g47800-like [Zingiber officinale]|uniref:BTB/POZ domain-containing protein At5g47800-like n=1 Tax=Zingiber officinale TaxID=94328 RepID=UPI001C4C1B0B|nr:BTB/POZ domain-containing protein At5g47800-like [Zingiber officinale]XP_042447028.1 BTB/POZ domain-containing protein At5g47800-like [Zingiber officinale]XP_042447029.1 BTB/POZ domain-containing protein At5g47800-like [Zingiber officinale]